MKDTHSMTMQDVLEMMKCIREFFTVVRLESGYDTMDSEETYCEIEYLKEDIFFVKAKRIEIDGKPYVIKIKQEVDEKILQALLESDQIPERLAYYNEKIYHDSLTGAYNRRFFQEKMISVSKNTGIVMIDLDNFKAYNDTYGHHAGDLVLQTTVMTIKSVIRRDDILIRYGGDEFLLLMPGMQSQVFHQKLLQIHQFIYQSEVPEYGKMHVSTSIGGVIAQGEEIEQAVERADKLMYAAKSQKSCVVTDVDEEVL